MKHKGFLLWLGLISGICVLLYAIYWLILYPAWFPWPTRITNELEQALDTADILFTTKEMELGVYQLNGQQKRIQIHLDTRFTYFREAGVLVYHPYWITSYTDILTATNRKMVEHNFDECSMVSYLPERQSLIYVTYKSLLEGQNTWEGGLVLAQYDRENSSQVLVPLSIIRDNVDGSNYCILGTHSEQDGYVYYKDALPSGENLLQQVNLESGEVKTIFTTDATIMAPAVSPDGKKIAFTQKDGIYMYHFDNGQIDKAVDVPWCGDTGMMCQGTFFVSYAPIVSWSPDGKQIVYSKYELYRDVSGENQLVRYDIYGYDLETRTETLLIKDGLYPYWIIN